MHFFGTKPDPLCLYGVCTLIITTKAEYKNGGGEFVKLYIESYVSNSHIGFDPDICIANMELHVNFAL